MKLDSSFYLQHAKESLNDATSVFAVLTNISIVSKHLNDTDLAYFLILCEQKLQVVIPVKYEYIF
jgi:hypothetical protein